MNINLIRYGQGLPVVFFHGWGFDHHVWLPLVDQLGSHYQLILVDLPGFGLSSSMSWDDFKSQLLAQLPPVFALVGWSLGGLYAQRLAIEESLRVSSLMSIGSSPYFIADPTWPAVPKEVFNHFYKNLSLDLEKTLRDFISLQLNKTKLTLPLGTMPTQKGLEEGLRILDQWDLRDELHTVSIPTSFLFGRLDPIAPVKIMQTMEIVYPNFNYVLFKKSAHMPFLSHQDLFINEFQRLIK